MFIYRLFCRFNCCKKRNAEQINAFIDINDPEAKNFHPLTEDAKHNQRTNKSAQIIIAEFCDLPKPVQPSQLKRELFSIYLYLYIVFTWKCVKLQNYLSFLRRSDTIHLKTNAHRAERGADLARTIRCAATFPIHKRNRPKVVRPDKTRRRGEDDTRWQPRRR